MVTTLVPDDQRDERSRHRPGLLLVHADHGLAPALIPHEHGLLLGREPPPTHQVISESSVSRLHVRLSRGTNGCAIDDLSSRNGTFVNGRRITSALLTHGDLVVLGEVIYRFVENLEAFPLAELDQFGIVGGARIQQLLVETIPLARTTLPILIVGESGVGKELFAQAIHAASRRTGSVVALNCSAIPASLLEAELFGHRRGAFTGASEDRRGHLLTADGGTLFLDEIGELPLEAQAKLLRVLETREVIPIGATTPQRVDLRVISATNRKLEDAISQGTFRGDLYARLNGHVVTVPPLRDRIEDLPRLVMHFLGKGAEVPAPSFYLAATHYRWPYNIRELRNAVERARALAGGERLAASHLPELIQACLPDTRGRAARPTGPLPPMPATASPPVPTKEALLALAIEHQGNVSAIARALRRDRALVHRWLKRHGISLETLRKP